MATDPLTGLETTPATGSTTPNVGAGQVPTPPTATPSATPTPSTTPGVPNTPDPSNPSTGPTAKAVTGMLAAGNPYIEQARSQGSDIANSRGVLNSSIGAGASQAAAYTAAVPIATNDANIAAAANLQTGQIASNEKIANLSATTQTTIAGMNITAAAQQQASQIIATAALQASQLKSDADLAQLQAQTQQTIASMNIDAASKQQLQQLASNELIAGQQNSTQLNIAGQNVSSNSQDKVSAASATYAQTYSSMVNAINANTAMPADARASALKNAQDLYNNGMQLVEQTYGVQLTWDSGGGPGSSANPTPSGSAAPVATADQTSTVTNLYQSLLGRAPDAGGLAQFSSELAAGKSVDDITAEIKGSPEYQAKTSGGFK